MKKLLFVMLITLGLGGLMAQMEKELKPVPAWSSFIGCTKSCSDYLGYDYSLPWLSGISGYAFLLNIHPELCPSGPTAFDNGFMKKNLEALGLHFEVLAFNKYEGDLQAMQKEALLKVQKALKAKQPVFGWELGMPEYYLIAGADEKGYRYFDFDGSIQSCPWDSVATSEIGMGEFCFLSAGKVQDPSEQLKSALSFFRDYQTNPKSYSMEGYTMGTEAYDVWITAMKEGNYNPWGLAYNTQVWAEARNSAQAFLFEARQKLGKDKKSAALDKAIASFKEVSEALGQIGKLYPFPPQTNKPTPENAGKAIEFLDQAKNAEIMGIKAVLEFADSL